MNQYDNDYPVTVITLVMKVVQAEKDHRSTGKINARVRMRFLT